MRPPLERPSWRTVLARTVVITIVTGLALGVIEGLTKVFYPEFANTVVFLVMVIILLLRPAGLFGKEK